MSKQDFTIMHNFVNQICESLENEPEKWNFGEYNIQHKEKFNGLKLWKGLDCVFMYENKNINIPIFSWEQGEKIRDSYYKGISIVGTKRQLEILGSLK